MNLFPTEDLSTLRDDAQAAKISSQKAETAAKANQSDLNSTDHGLLAILNKAEAGRSMVQASQELLTDPGFGLAALKAQNTAALEVLQSDMATVRAAATSGKVPINYGDLSISSDPLSAGLQSYVSPPALNRLLTINDVIFDFDNGHYYKKGATYDENHNVVAVHIPNPGSVHFIYDVYQALNGYVFILYSLNNHATNYYCLLDNNGNRVANTSLFNYSNCPGLNFYVFFDTASQKFCINFKASGVAYDRTVTLTGTTANESIRPDTATLEYPVMLIGGKLYCSNGSHSGISHLQSGWFNEITPGSNTTSSNERYVLYGRGVGALCSRLAYHFNSSPSVYYYTMITNIRVTAMPQLLTLLYNHYLHSGGTINAQA